MPDTAAPPLPQHDWPEFPPGLVWLLGAGPGDPGLLTLHGLHALREAEVIVYDALVDTRLLAWRAPSAETLYAGKRGGKPSANQRDISAQLIELSRAGNRVLRLKGGDPFVFGRGGEEGAALVQAGVPIRITPGVSAGIGGLAAAGIPVTHRDVNQAVTFLTGHDARGLTPAAIDWPALARGAPVIVMYMALKHLETISAELLAAGRAPEEPVAVVADASLPGMRVLETTLATAARDVATAGIGAPAIVCLGEVVRMRRLLGWAAEFTGAPPPVGSTESEAS